MAKRRGEPVHGWFNLDKPVGMSSAKAVAIVRRVFNAAKAGHGGTLDPLASGVLPIALGEATKTVSYAMDGKKSYVFTVTWGTQTTTDDLEGDVVEISLLRPTLAAITAIIPNFTGDILQTPPAPRQRRFPFNGSWAQMQCRIKSNSGCLGPHHGHRPQQVRSPQPQQWHSCPTPSTRRAFERRKAMEPGQNTPRRPQ